MLGCSLIFDAASVVAAWAAYAGAVAGTGNTEAVRQFAETAEATDGRVFLECEDGGDDESDFADKQSFQDEETDNTEEKR